jgi:RHS repeat-associated protein
LENKKGFNGNELQNKEFSDGSGLELYDFNARTYDQEIGRFIQIDPTPDDGDQESLTPYHFSGNNPSTFNDPNGKCPWCDEIKEGLKAAVTATVATVATVAVAVDNVLGTNVTGSIANSGDVPTTQINNWNTAVTSANNASVVVGTGATIVGGGIATGSAATTIGSGGTTAIVTAPAFVVGVATAAVGAVVTANASKNLANGNGIIKQGSESNPQPSSGAARRDAMRKEGIPTSQQPTNQKQTSAGRVLEYEVPKPGGGTIKKQAQQQTKDRNHGPHWEVGTPKPGGQTDPAGRNRLQNGKSKSFYK